MDNASARNLWGDYLDKHLEYAFNEEPRIRKFGTDAENCDVLNRRILKGKKRAVTHALLDLQNRKERLPKIGDFTILTDWKGEAQCILRTVAVRLKPFFSINETYAKLDLDDDKNHVEQWKELHWSQFESTLNGFGRVPRESMIVVCEIFEKVYQR